jgi:hypothetical protein
VEEGWYGSCVDETPRRQVAASATCSDTRGTTPISSVHSSTAGAIHQRLRLFAEHRTHRDAYSDVRSHTDVELFACCAAAYSQPSKGLG